MRSPVPTYEMRSALDLAAALELLSREPGVWRPFAGGTDLMVLLEQGKLSHKKFVNLWKLNELRGIEVTNSAVAIGALATYTDIRNHSVLQREFPMLCEAAALTGGVATQNRGTLGGNIANASPAADSPPALLAYDAQLELISARGRRRVPYAAFHTGYKQMDMRVDELIYRIHLARNQSPSHSYYRKVGTRKAQAISKVCFAGIAQLAKGRISNVRLALGSVAPTVIRCAATEGLLRQQAITPALITAACKQIAGEIAPIDDMRSTAHYRARVSQNLLRQFLQSLPVARA
jgi:CO/xanthine dehydrogenase FAD-binding subunit